MMELGAQQAISDMTSNQDTRWCAISRVYIEKSLVYLLPFGVLGMFRKDVNLPLWFSPLER
jgi:hypothetical protein